VTISHSRPVRAHILVGRKLSPPHAWRWPEVPNEVRKSIEVPEAWRGRTFHNQMINMAPSPIGGAVSTCAESIQRLGGGHAWATWRHRRKTAGGR